MSLSPLEATLQQLELELQNVLKNDDKSLELDLEVLFLKKLSNFRTALRRANASLALTCKDSSHKGNDDNIQESDSRWLQNRFAEYRALSLDAENLAIRFRDFIQDRKKQRSLNDKKKLFTIIKAVTNDNNRITSSSATTSGDNLSSLSFENNPVAQIRQRRRAAEVVLESNERAKLLKQFPGQDVDKNRKNNSVEALRLAVAGMQDNAVRAFSSTRIVSNDADAMRRTLQHHASLYGGMSEGASRVSAHKNKTSRDRAVLLFALAILVGVAMFLSARRLLWAFLGVELRIF
jgi:hypothetical protein